MKLEHLFSYHANLGDFVEVGKGPFGVRHIAEVHGGAFEGEKLKGIIREPAGADWLTVGETHGHLDVRLTFETHDGAFIFVEYTGKLEMTEKVASAISGESSTDFGDQYFFTAIRMQCGDERYSWVNNIVCVGEGRIMPNKVEYRVFMVKND